MRSVPVVLTTLRRHQATCVLEAAAVLGEGPHWWVEEQLLLWVDINDAQIGLFDPATGLNRMLPLPVHGGCVVPTLRDDLLLATAAGFQRLDPRSGALTPVHDPERHLPGNRFNDGKCDPWGRLWAGTMAYDLADGCASLWRIDASLESERMLSGVSISNGLAWSHDRRSMYFIDSPTLEVRRFPLSAEGDLLNQGEVCIRIPASWNCLPDGMAIDREGMLWIALFDGGAVSRWNPNTGDHLATVELPCSKVTSCCFGGKDYGQLFITTATEGLTSEERKEQPQAGGLFMADVGVRGLPPQLFLG
ncbi:MAG: SMP-30/gluconolactonase/LRE family protein [Synechococcus sp. MED-G71]|nr:MAG: SMP-30/gluconolactonase/LRE family protein [Synechococcus sp. MED-G71]